jgi:hypothetical protein
MMADVGDLDRLKCAGADVQGDEGPSDAAAFEALKDLRREVQAGGRGGDGAGSGGVDGW